MGQFVQTGPVIIDLVEESGLRWHLHEIGIGRVECLGPADAEIDPRSGNDFLGNGHDLAFGKRRGIGRQPGAQALALRDIEHGKPLQEGHGARLVAVALGALLFGLGSEAVGIDYGHAMLALADAAARFPRLPEGQPALGRPAMLDDRAPQDQDVDARISAAIAAARSALLSTRIVRPSDCGNDAVERSIWRLCSTARCGGCHEYGVKDRLHHVLQIVGDYDAAMRAFEAVGGEVIVSGTFGGGKVAYVDPGAGPGGLVEIFQPGEGAGALFEMIKQASVDWDGCDPVRRLG